MWRCRVPCVGIKLENDILDYRGTFLVLQPPIYGRFRHRIFSYLLSFKECVFFYDIIQIFIFLISGYFFFRATK